MNEQATPYTIITDQEMVNRYFEDDDETLQALSVLSEEAREAVTLSIFIRAEDRYAGYILDFGDSIAPEEDDDYDGVRRFLDIEPSIEICQLPDGDIRIYAEDIEYYTDDEVIEYLESKHNIAASSVEFIEKEKYEDSYRYIFKFIGEVQTKQELWKQYEMDLNAEFSNIEFEKEVETNQYCIKVFTSGDALFVGVDESDAPTYLVRGWTN